MEHAARLESAVKDYLDSQTAFTDNVLIRTSESDEDKNDSTIVAMVDGDMGDEEPPFSNNRWCEFVIELRTPVLQDDPDNDWLADHSANTAALENCILDDAFETALRNSQIYVYKVMNRRPFSEQNQDYWASGYRLRIYSCRV